MCFTNLSFLVDQCGKRQAAGLVSKRGVVHWNPRTGDEGGVVHIMLGCKSLNVFYAVKRKTHYLHPIFVSVLNLHQRWNFSTAGDTPGCPEINYQDWLFKFTELVGLTTEPG